MSREDLRDNKFERAAAIPLNWSPETGDKRPVPDDLKKAEVWEIWDKSRRKRIWIVKGYDKPLRVDDDPYGLEDSSRCPSRSSRSPTRRRWCRARNISNTATRPKTSTRSSGASRGSPAR